MTVSMNAALQAYRNAARSVPLTEPGNSTGYEGDGQPGFSDLVRESLRQAIDVNRTGEAMSLLGIAGEADLRDVILAVNNAETALNTVIAVRDKVVNAYQSILQMPI